MTAITTSVKLDPETKVRLQSLATARDRKPHYLLLEAVQQYVEREERRERLRQEALAAWADFQASGLHVTSVEADDWLAKLEQGGDVDTPECHG